MPSTAPRHIAEKVDKLAEHALDFFAEQKLLTEMHKEPEPAVAQLLDALDEAKHGYHRTLLRRVWQEVAEDHREKVGAVLVEHALSRGAQHAVARAAALDLLASSPHKLDQDGMAFLRVAQDSTEALAIRCQSMLALRSARIGKTCAASLTRMIENLDAPPALVQATADIVKFHEKAIDRKGMRDALMLAVFSSDAQIRRRVIELLGLFGDVDTIEIVC